MDNYPYSLLRIELNPRRGEVVNIGVVVFLADRLDVRINPATTKLRALDPNFDAAHFPTLPAWLAEVDAMAEGASTQVRHQNLAKNAGIEIGPLASFRLPSPTGYERQIDSLMTDLVFPPPVASVRQQRLARLETQLRQDFTRRGVFSPNLQDIEAHKIVAQYPISAEENLTADFALRNGALHVFALVDFRGSPGTVRDAKFKTTAVKAVTLDVAGKRRSARPFAVIAAPESVLEMAQAHISILNDYSERVFNVMRLDDSEALMAHVVAAAGDSR